MKGGTGGFLLELVGTGGRDGTVFVVPLGTTVLLLFALGTGPGPGAGVEALREAQCVVIVGAIGSFSSIFEGFRAAASWSWDLGS